MKIKRLTDTATIPQYQTSGAAGFDFHASERQVIMPGETVLVPTGLSFEVPTGFELQVRPRSGMTVKTKLRVAFGTVDSDYRGEIKIIIDNIGHSPYTVDIGDRIAQGVMSMVSQFDFEEVTELSETERGAGGFGSTNK